MEERARIGVVLFDRPERIFRPESSAGFFSIAGSNPTRFDGLFELPTDYCWITNSPVIPPINNITMASLTLFPSAHLGVDLHTILSELGSQHIGLRKQVVMLSEIVANISILTKRVLKGSLCESPMPVLVQKRFTIPVESNHVDIDKIAIYTNHGQTICTPDFSIDASTVVLTIPRFKHAHGVLLQGLPTGKFKRVDKCLMPKQRLRAQWVIDQNRPAIVKVGSVKISAAIRELLPINITGFLGKNRYITSNELEFLNLYASVSVTDVYLCDKTFKTAIASKISNNPAVTSYSFHLVYEALWRSLTVDSKGVKIRTPLSAWVFAEDRIRCMQYAIKLNKLGYPIVQYGAGTLSIKLLNTDRNRLLLDCLTLGLLPPVGVCNPDQSFDEFPDSWITRFIIMHGRGSASSVIQRDCEYVKRNRNILVTS